MIIDAQFSIGDKVNVDGCTELVGVVTAVQWRSYTHVTYEVSWISNGDSKSPLIEEWRLARIVK